MATASVERNSIRQPEVIQPERFHNDYVFRLEYDADTPDKVLHNDLITYLQEYRLQVKKTHYELLYTKDQDGSLALRSSDNGASMLSIGKNAILDREKNGKPVKKEIADFIGLQKIQNYLQDAKQGETILWASPPDPEVGYEYGFFYIGTVEELDTEQKRLNMAAIRLDNTPSLEQFNSALSLLTQQPTEYEGINEFITNPHHIKRTISDSETNLVIKGVFDVVLDVKEQAKTKKIEAQLQPYIATFKDMVRKGAPQNMLQRMLFAIENYTLQMKNEEDDKEAVFHASTRTLGTFIDEYAYIPPQVIGSCDVSPSGSPNILGYGSIFSDSFGVSSSRNEKTWSYTWGECVMCESTFTQVGPCSICKTCEKKFD